MGVGVMGARGESARLVVARPVWLGGWLANDRLIVRSHTASPTVKDYVDDFYAVDLATDKLENLTRSDPELRAVAERDVRRSQTAGEPGRGLFRALRRAATSTFTAPHHGSDIIGGKTDKDWLIVNTFPPSDLTLEQSVERTNPMGERLGFAGLADRRAIGLRALLRR